MDYYSEPGSLMSLIYIAAALIPAAVLLWYIYRLDKIEKEPASLLAKLFLCGVAAAVPAMLLEELGEAVVLPSLMIRSETVYYVLFAVMVGLVEEACKYFFLRRGTWNNPDFNFRYDGVVYAVFVSLGFAAIENIFYVFEYGLTVALLRALLAIPGHMSFAVFMGSFYGQAKICEVRGDPAGRLVNLILAYVSAVLLHSIYDACAMVGSTWSTVLFVVFIIAMYTVVFKKLKRESGGDVSVYH